MNTFFWPWVRRREIFNYFLVSRYTRSTVYWNKVFLLKLKVITQEKVLIGIGVDAGGELCLYKVVSSPSSSSQHSACAQKTSPKVDSVTLHPPPSERLTLEEEKESLHQAHLCVLCVGCVVRNLAVGVKNLPRAALSPPPLRSSPSHCKVLDLSGALASLCWLRSFSLV